MVGSSTDNDVVRLLLCSWRSPQLAGLSLACPSVSRSACRSSTACSSLPISPEVQLLLPATQPRDPAGPHRLSARRSAQLSRHPAAESSSANPSSSSSSQASSPPSRWTVRRRSKASLASAASAASAASERTFHWRAQRARVRSLASAASLLTLERCQRTNVPL